MLPFRSLVLIAALFPLLDLALVGWLGVWVSWRFVAILILGTGLLGAVLLGRLVGQLRRAWSSGRRGRARGRLAAAPLASAAAGVLLILPGPMGDLLGLALLVPPVRQLLVLWLTDRAIARLAAGVQRVSRPAPAPQGPGTVIDVEHRPAAPADGDSPPAPRREP